MGRINSAVRFKAWLNDSPLDEGVEILGDGFLLCTPFGSTAYFNKLTRCIFWEGLGIAWNAANQYTSHLVVPESTVIRMAITRGPAMLAFDSADKFYELDEGDELEARKHAGGATLLTYGRVQVPSLPF
jgi:NAD+ kinase